MAREVASQLDHLRANGDLSIHAGRIVEMKPSSDGLRVTFVDRQSMTRRSLDVAAVINATGPAPDWRTSPPALVRSLVACGLARFDPLGLGLDTTPEGFLLDTTGAPQPWLATLGPPMRGGLWETTAVPEIREQARRLADLWCR
jgi:uncharacterized NAD(P)/FAD-binding protein YdhS